MAAKQIIRSNEVYGTFHSTLTQIERIDPEEVRRVQEANDIERMKSAGYEEGQARGYRNGYDEGHQHGHAKGHDLGYGEAKLEFETEHAGVLDNLQTSLVALLADFQKARDNWFIEAERRHAELAYEVARRALASELAIGRESVLAIAKEVLTDARAGISVQVRVNPKDVSILEAHKAELLAALTNIRGLEVMSDQSVGAGVIIDSNEGLVDARVESYLERIVQGHLREAA